MPGPLPQAEKRRRNAPTIATTTLPASGRSGDAPECPFDLGEAGQKWWEWAWHTPQACGWDENGDLYAVARRAVLEDDIAAVESDDISVAEVLGMDEDEATKELDWIIRRLKGLAGSKNALSRLIADADKQLGLTPKGLADLRWQITAEVEELKPAKPEKKASDRRARLRAV